MPKGSTKRTVRTSIISLKDDLIVNIQVMTLDNKPFEHAFLDSLEKQIKMKAL